jgi:YD repeat-containing protein
MVSYQNGNGAQVQWVYNLRNLPMTITYPGSLNVTRGYDNAGRWTSVQDWNSNTTSFGYDPDSNLTLETFPAASTVVDTFTFNAADQMTNVASVKGGSTTLFSAGYSRDSANQLTSDTSAASGTGSDKYTPLNQVCYAGSSNTNACSSPPSGSIVYAYDAADNLTTERLVTPGVQQRRRALLDRIVVRRLRIAALGCNDIPVRHQGQSDQHHARAGDRLRSLPTTRPTG